MHSDYHDVHAAYAHHNVDTDAIACYDIVWCQCCMLHAGGGCASLCSQTLAVPVDVVTQRLMLQGNQYLRTTQYKSGVDAVRTIVNKEGIKGMCECACVFVRTRVCVCVYVCVWDCIWTSCDTMCWHHPSCSCIDHVVHSSSLLQMMSGERLDMDSFFLNDQIRMHSTQIMLICITWKNHFQMTEVKTRNTNTHLYCYNIWKMHNYVL